MKTKIILAFPCLGKTHYAKNNPDKAIDLESSDYFFDKTGYEHLTSEEFKGLPDRKPNPNGLQDYLKAIDRAVKSNKYEYIFTSQSPDVVKGILDLGYQVHYVKPLPNELSKIEFRKRALSRGNNEKWIETTIKFLEPSPLSYFNEDEIDNIFIHLIPSKLYLTDVIENDLI
jgi:hypothetical protein